MAGDSACDVVLVGAGIMSATLATLLRELDPGLRIAIFERLHRAAAESSDAWNNAGTGHAGYCELNYTPASRDGTVDCSKALRIAAQFGLSLELWRSCAPAICRTSRRSSASSGPQLRPGRGRRPVPPRTRAPARGVAAVRGPRAQR